MAIQSFIFADGYNGKVQVTVFYNDQSLNVTKVQVVNQTANAVALTFTGSAIPGGTLTQTFGPGTTSQNLPAGSYTLGRDVDGNLFFPDPVSVNFG